MQQHGGAGTAEALDVGERAAVQAAAGRMLERWGRLDVLMNNAALNEPRRRFHEVSDADFDRMVQTNLVGAYNLIQAVLPAMRAQGGGLIGNVASMAGKQAHPMSGPGYCASKFGMVGLSHTVNVEEWPHGVLATALCPGEIDTPFVDRRVIVPDAAARAQMLQAEDVAETIRWLAMLPPRCSVPELWLVPARPRAPLPGETL